MRAITYSTPGGPEVLAWTEVPDPSPGPGEVLIEVAATAVNRADIVQRRGYYPPPPGASDILGLECSGTVAALGEGAEGWSVGDRVCALLAGGGYAELVTAPATQLLPVPDGVDLHAAAALPEVACTVWSNLVMIGGMHAGQLVLIHGGGGGIGTHAIQVAVALGATVVTTAGSAGKLAACRELGAAVTVNYKDEDFVTAVAATGRGADLILDNMGAAYLGRNIDALAMDGQLCVIGMQGGRVGELDLGTLVAKRGRVFATGLRGRPATGPSGKAEIVSAVTEQLWPMIADGRVRPVVHTELPITDAAAGQLLLDSPDTVGKVVLAVR